MKTPTKPLLFLIDLALIFLVVIMIIFPWLRLLK